MAAGFGAAEGVAVVVDVLFAGRAVVGVVVAGFDAVVVVVGVAAAERVLLFTKAETLDVEVKDRRSDGDSLVEEELRR